MATDSSGESAPGNTIRLLGSVGIVVAVVIIAFVVYKIKTRDTSESQALKVATTFVRSSPVVEENLGTVSALKESNEQHVDGQGWTVDFNVTGMKSHGTVALTLHKQNGAWTFSSAELERGHGKPTNLL